MSLPMKAVERLFQRLGATYGAAWTRQWADVPMSDVQTAWAHELSVFADWLEAIAWALDNLPPRCPNVIEFKNLCRQAPARAVAALPAPAADPARIAAELAKLAPLRQATASVAAGAAIDHKAWAKRIMARHDAGDNINPASLRFAREALRLHLSGVEA